MTRRFLYCKIRSLVFWISVVIGHCSALKELPKTLDDPLIGSEKGAIHVVTSSECNGNYLVYQTWAQKYTFDRVHQPGKYTRIVSCDEPDSVTEEDRSMMDTLIVPNWKNHPTKDDAYPPYNKPVGIMYWLAERKPTAEWTLIVDPDMLFRQPFLLKDFEVPEGYAVSSTYSYMNGVQNELAERHLPDVKPREDTYGGSKGRRADMSGAFYFMRTKDLVKVAPLWLKYTEDVRYDPLAWKLTGDSYAKPGERPWISEMYGYVYGAAAANVWHKLDSTAQYYTGYEVQDIPVIIHYGINNTVLDYYFVKHEHLGFDMTKCPPWNLNFGRENSEDAGLFPHPPFPSKLPDMPPREKYGKLLVIETMNTLNKALCIRHKKMCSESEQLTRECETVDKIAKALDQEYDSLSVDGVVCYDTEARCQEWATEGECEKNWMYMDINCRRSCNKCRNYIPIHSYSKTVSTNETSLQKEKIKDTTEVMFVTRGNVGYISKRKTQPQKEEVGKESIVKENVEVISTLADKKENVEVTSTLSDKKENVEVISTLADKKENVEVISTLSDKKEDVEVVSTLSDKKEDVEVVSTLADNKESVEVINTLADKKEDVEVISTLADKKEDAEVISTLADKKEEKEVFATDDEIEDIKRCENLSKTEFYSDFRCLELAEKGLVHLDHPRVLTLMRNSKAKQQITTNLSSYGYLGIFTIVIILLVVSRKLPSMSRRKTPLKHQ